MSDPMMQADDATADYAATIRAQLVRAERNLALHPTSAGHKACVSRLASRLALIEAATPARRPSVAARRQEEVPTGPVVRLDALDVGDRFCYSFNSTRRGRVVRVGLGSVSVKMESDHAKTVTLHNADGTAKTVTLHATDGIITLAHASPVRRLAR